MTYSKDGSVNNNGDFAHIYNVVLSDLPSAIVSTAAENCISDFRKVEATW